MGMISYAQNHEDVLLRRVFPGPIGFYVDIGAADPVEHSVTKWFSDQGWSGINVEPLTAFYQRLVADRPRDINLNIAVGESAGEMTFHEVPSCVGWATLDAAAAAKLRDEGTEVLERTVHVRTLAEIAERYIAGPIDFLKIDVEGAERAVLQGANFERWRPRVLVIEATEAGRPIPDHESWEPLVLKAGYLFATFDGLNRYYVREEDRDLVPVLQPPISVFDDFKPYAQARVEAELEARLAELEVVRAGTRSAQAETEAVRQDNDAKQKHITHLEAHIQKVFGELESSHKRLIQLEGVEVRVAEAIATREQFRQQVSVLEATLQTRVAELEALRVHQLADQAAAHQAKYDHLASVSQTRYEHLEAAFQQRTTDLEAVSRRLAEVNQAATQAEARLAELEAENDRLQSMLSALKAGTVARPAYDAALRLLDETRIHLDTLRSEFLQPKAG